MLLIGFHMHQPVDNLSEAVENAVNFCYRPLFKTLRKYPEFKFSLHSSGWLLEQLKEKYSDVFDDILYLNEKGSIEFFSGGFYEPVLASIPKEDRIIQIQKLNNFIKNNFSKTPKGLWLTERVWEDSIIDEIKKCNLEYLMVDDYHFLCAGFDKSELDGYFFSEYSGEKIGIFPISKELRYAIPFYLADDAVNLIKNKKTAIIFDDAEKFGLWPGTNEWVYKQKWLENFIEKILNSNIKTSHFSEAFSKKSNGIAYLPNVSYYEMGEWSLRPKDAIEYKNLINKIGKDYFEKQGIKFIKGGIWKNFFVKYPESNHLHKRMLEISKKKKSENLYKLQTNDVFWHGVFGGLYLPNLRDNAYKYLCECEKELFICEYVNKEDFNFDGVDEIKIVKKDFIYIFSLLGGRLIEFSDKEKAFNFQNTLTRRFESYHNEILNSTNEENNSKVTTIHNLKKEADFNVKDYLFYDRYQKVSFIDLVSDESFNIDSFKKNNFNEFAKFYEKEFKNEGLKFSYEDKEYKITKNFNINEKTDFEINLEGKGNIYAMEFNFHFAHNILINGNEFNDELELKGSEFIIFDSYTKRKIKFTFTNEMKAVFANLYTVSQNEKGYSLTLQGVSFAFYTSFDKMLQLKGSLEIE